MRSIFAVATLVAILAACGPTPTSIEFDGDPSATVNTLDALTLPAAKVLDASGKSIEGQKVTWTVTPDNIAQVDVAAGKIVPLADGVAQITAKLDKIEKSYTLTVSLPDTVQIDAPASNNVAIGATLALTGKVLADGNPVEGAALTWETSDAALATVDATGTVTGVAAGEVTITAKSGELAATTLLVIAAADPAAAAPQ